VAVALPVGVVVVVFPAGELAADGDDSQFTSVGTAISAPMAKKTAAMTTLGNCIAFLPARRPPVRTRARPLFLDQCS
jgi:hypothetical protein